ncbi:hypothetical protein ElyMa_003565300 [Elysia marginata]|uniref:Uncharacterized protein n=1 Tax=Elysia marginata TaxID=1093978 RepID=A0AAV4EM45_9GAST|nr:hypothetical protein ElyMa_003565300 [Elysia marginata]
MASPSNLTGFQALTLVLVFFMGMFIAGSMFFTFPILDGPIAHKIKAATSSFSTLIGREPGRENMPMAKDDTQEKFLTKNTIQSDITVNQEDYEYEHSYGKKRKHKKHGHGIIVDEDVTNLEEETQENLGLFETDKRHGRRKKLKKAKYGRRRRPHTLASDVSSGESNSDLEVNPSTKKIEIVTDDDNAESKQGKEQTTKKFMPSKMSRDSTLVSGPGSGDDESKQENQINVSYGNITSKIGKDHHAEKSTPAVDDDQKVENSEMVLGEDKIKEEIDEKISGKDVEKPKKDNRDEKIKYGDNEIREENEDDDSKPKNDGKDLKNDDSGRDIDKKDNSVDEDVNPHEEELWKPKKSNKQKIVRTDSTKETLEGTAEKGKKGKKSNGFKRDVPLWGNTDEKSLLDIFETKLNKVESRPKKLGDTCYNDRTISNSCKKDGCLQMKRPSKPWDRMRQLVRRPGLTLTDPQHGILREMASHVTGMYDVILLTTASSNHFLESQALLQNLHQNVFPVLKNFTLLFYDLGLTPAERKEMEKFCRCQVLSFPFEKLPDYVRNLKCYAWKPLMVKAHIRQANVLLWLDASIRFNGDSDKLQSLIQRVRDRGVQIGRSGADSTFRTFRSMYHYFGDEPCMYLGMGQAQATIGGYHSEPFVDRVILEPWVACALNQDCMCPATNRSAGCFESKKMAENVKEHHGPIIYGLCHRFDQSAITLILHKLYQNQYQWVMMRVKQYGRIERDNQVEYFKTLYKR